MLFVDLDSCAASRQSLHYLMVHIGATWRIKLNDLSSSAIWMVCAKTAEVIVMPSGEGRLVWAKETMSRFPNQVLSTLEI